MAGTSKIECYFDGACFPNPNGHAAYGVLVKQDGRIIFTHAEYIGNENTSCNVAEYAGLIAVLTYLVENQIHNATIYGDSMLVIRQMSGKWRAGQLTKHERSGKTPIKPRYYLPYYERALALRLKLDSLTFNWIPRHLNEEADELSKQPLREKGFVYEPVETDLGYARMRFEQVTADI